MNKLLNLYRKDRHIARLVIMIVAWMAFMAITRFDKFYTVINFTTMAASHMVRSCHLMCFLNHFPTLEEFSYDCKLDEGFHTIFHILKFEISLIRSSFFYPLFNHCIEFSLQSHSLHLLKYCHLLVMLSFHLLFFRYFSSFSTESHIPIPSTILVFVSF